MSMKADGLASVTQFTCGSCGTSFAVPDALGELRERFAQLARSGRAIEAIRDIRIATGLGLLDAKGVHLHLTRKRGFCHRCSTALPNGDTGIAVCARCKSLNLDW
jgi:RNase P subunit RPR2